MDAHDNDAGAQGAEELEALLLAPVIGSAPPTAEESGRIQDRLRRRETALRAVLEGLPDATVAASREGRIVFANERAEELFGYRAQELIGKPVSMLWAERVRERYLRNMELYFATEHPLRFSTKVEGLRSDGSEFVGEMSWGIVETEAGALLLAIGRDISDRRAAMARLRRQSEQQMAVAALGERALAGADLADLAHEAIERMHQTLPISHAQVRRGGEVIATWGTPAAAAFALEIRMGEQGELVVVPTADDLLADDEQSFLRALANVLAGAMARRRGEERMRHEALHDPLTGLANRTLCRDRIVHALARAGRDTGEACVLFIDLDAFKRVNDLYGHAAGDALLIGLSRRLLATVRPVDTVARLGGDEFVVVCEGIDEDTAVALGHRLAETISEPLEAGGLEHRLSAGIGIALGTASRRDPDALLADADAAAYRAKAAGHGRVEVFDRRLRKHAQERLRTAEALERALSLGQLRLAFQPIISLATSASSRRGPGQPSLATSASSQRDTGQRSLAGEGIVGHEALLRWDRPGGGASAPADFIPVAEESALIVEIGAWALMQACRELADSGSTGDVWVNLSSRQLAQPDLPELVADCLERADLSPHRLKLELTETVLQQATSTGLSNVAQLAAAGVGIALDDFGTGYSSLGHLGDVPLAGVKIDRSFVAGLGRNEHGAAIVAAIISLTRALGLDAVAEGVESERQADLLRELGCPLAQGYLFGAPGPGIG